MEHEKLLDESVLTTDGDDDTINVFSIASGHLYERFMSLMMLSVRKQTKHKVKFWLFEPPMSPSFKVCGCGLCLASHSCLFALSVPIGQCFLHPQLHICFA